MNKVYVKVNADGCITAVNSDAHLLDTDGWVYVDQGEGDRFTHAQGQYLPGTLKDESGRLQYRLTDGAAVKRTPEEIEADPLPAPGVEALTLLHAQVNALTERGEFVEDCIAELAGEVYGDP